MKNFSTAARLLAFACFFSPLGAIAQQTTSHVPVATRCGFLANAPDQHMVVKGDTLWDISSKFLQNAWCWPQVWDMNREQIRNPHWIYPGQIVYLDRVAGRLRLGNPTTGMTDGTVKGDVRLSPQQRVQGLGKDAISAIPAGVIEPFLVQPLILEDSDMDTSLRIVGTQDGRVNIGRGDRAYVLGDLDGGTSFQAFRQGKPLKDPENKNNILGHEAVYLGTLKLLKDGDNTKENTNTVVAHSFTVVSSKEEMGVGDLLLPVKPTPFINYAPHPPTQEIDARVVSIYGGVSQAGQHQVVVINRGESEGIDRGTVLQLYRHGKIIVERANGKKKFKVPDEQYGTLFIFRVFNNLAYGLVMQVTEAVKVGDVARSPE